MRREKSTEQATSKVIATAVIGVLLAVCFVSCGGGGGSPGAPIVVSGGGDSGSGSGSGSGSSSGQNLPEDEEQFDSLSL